MGIMAGSKCKDVDGLSLASDQGGSQGNFLIIPQAKHDIERNSLSVSLVDVDLAYLLSLEEINLPEFSETSPFNFYPTFPESTCLALLFTFSDAGQETQDTTLQFYPQAMVAVGGCQSLI